MGKLNIGVEIRDFDLERMGFSLSVLDDTKKRQSSEAYLRMTLPQLNTLLAALRAADEIEVSTAQPSLAAAAGSLAKAPFEAWSGPAAASRIAAPDEDNFLSSAIKAKLSADAAMGGGAASRARPAKP